MLCAVESVNSLYFGLFQAKYHLEILTSPVKDFGKIFSPINEYYSESTSIFKSFKSYMCKGFQVTIESSVNFP